MAKRKELTEDQAKAQQLHADAAAKREERIANERETVRAALKRANGFLKRAAEELGMNRQTLQSWLAPTGRHALLGGEAALMRESVGWTGGRPPTAE
jgi:transcriptional regulator with PAS, ATPase and Fis domain